MRAATVCVDYASTLALTLPYNRHHFTEYLVVTTPSDLATQRVARANNCYLHLSNAFYRNGAYFNKWLALEEGLACFGRHDWMCMLDADIFWPQNPQSWQSFLCPGFIYTPLRRMKPEVSWCPEDEWGRYPLHHNQSDWAGYTQIFHADDPHLPKPPWHQVDWIHAGGADTFLQANWPSSHKLRPPFEVLHIGEPGKNWCGTSPDAQAALKELLSKRVYPKTPTTYDHERITLS